MNVLKLFFFALQEKRLTDNLYIFKFYLFRSYNYYYYFLNCTTLLQPIISVVPLLGLDCYFQSRLWYEYYYYPQLIYLIHLIFFLFIYLVSRISLTHFICTTILFVEINFWKANAIKLHFLITNIFFVIQI